MTLHSSSPAKAGDPVDTEGKSPRMIFPNTTSFGVYWMPRFRGA